MKFSKTLLFSLFIAAFAFGLASIASAHTYHPVHTHSSEPMKIEKVKRYASTIEVTVPNMNLHDNENYYLYCEEQPTRKLSFSYRSPDKEWQFKAQPKHSKHKYSDTVTLYVRGTIEDRDYKCNVSIQVEEHLDGKFLTRTSESKLVKTLTGEVPNYKIYKKGVQAQYLNRVKPEVTRFVTPKPNVIVLRARNYWNAVAWGPEYYMSSFYR